MNQCHCKDYVCYPSGTGKMKHTPCGDRLGYEEGTIELCQATRTLLTLKLYKMKQKQSPEPITDESQKGSGEVPEGMTLAEWARMDVKEKLKAIYK